MKQFLISIPGAMFSVILLLSPVTYAQSLSTMAGVWNGITFDVPSQLTTEVSTNGEVTNVNQKQAFGAGAFQVAVQSNGSFTSQDGGGSISVDGQGVFTVYPSGSPSIPFRVNYAQDVFVGLAPSDNGNNARNQLNLVVRAPASLTGAEVAGTWTMIMFSTPQQLIENLTTNGTLQDLTGMDNQSLSSSSFSGLESGSMTINSDGTLSGIAQGNFTGTYTIGANGQIDVSIDTGEGLLAMTFSINSSKDTMFTVLNENTNNRQEAIMLTKNPTSVTAADLQGVWNVASFDVPAQLTLWKNTNNIVIGISPGSGFNMDFAAQFITGHDGFLTGIMGGESNIGTLSASNDGTATVVFTNGLGQVETHIGHLNAGKDCMMFADTGNSRGISVVTKAPEWPGNTQNFGLQLFNGWIVWASDTNVVLQSSGTLNGGWTNIPSTLSQHQFQPAFTNAAAFYRAANQ